MVEVSAVATKNLLSFLAMSLDNAHPRTLDPSSCERIGNLVRFGVHGGLETKDFL